MKRSVILFVLSIAVLGGAGCTVEFTPTGGPTRTGATATPEPSAAATPDRTPSPSPTATAAPPLSLDLPADTDPRQVAVSVAPDLAPDSGGTITVTVTSNASEMVRELVLRWPTELNASLVLAPFLPDTDLVREGGGNLVRPWTKWVLGPGEQGEPPGTISLGYGPLEPGATLTIPIHVARLAPGPVAFDLQVLAGETILTLPDGQPAEQRVEVP